MSFDGDSPRPGIFFKNQEIIKQTHPDGNADGNKGIHVFHSRRAVDFQKSEKSFYHVVYSPSRCNDICYSLIKGVGFVNRLHRYIL